MQTTEAPVISSHTVSIAWSGNGFSKAVSHAKRLNGKYDPSTKTWTVRVYHCEIFRGETPTQYLASKGLKVVGPAATSGKGWGEDEQDNEAYWAAQR